MFYRVKQFIEALTAHISEEEKAFVKKHLTPKEYEIFFKLQKDEQHHAIKVAELMSKRAVQGHSERMIRLGLLHDIGKVVVPLNILEKSLMVILDKLTKGKIEHYSQLKMVRGYYNHAENGYRLLKEIGSYDEQFLECIKKHHQNIKVTKDRQLLLLQQCDQEK